MEDNSISDSLEALQFDEEGSGSEFGDVGPPSSDDEQEAAEERAEETADVPLLPGPDLASPVVQEALLPVYLSKRCPTQPPTVAFVEFLPEGHRPPDKYIKFKTKRLYYQMRDFNTKVVKLVLQSAGFKATQGDEWNAFWAKSSTLRPEDYRQLSEYQRVNHFPGNFQLGHKDRLYANIQRMRRSRDPEEFDFLPKSFALPQDQREFEAEFGRAPPGTLWILKPKASSRGRGIRLLARLSQVPREKEGVPKEAVVQRYVANPYLVDGFKFDMRLYVAVMGFDPLRVYLHKRGLARFCTDKYRASAATVKKRYMHLTNYSVNKKRPTFVPNADANEDGTGSKWSLAALLARLEREVGPERVAGMMARVRDAVVKTFIAVESTIVHRIHQACPHRNVCYELFGIDVLIDENLKPYIMEVNTSPSLNLGSPLDRRVKAEVISDLFNMAAFVPVNRARASREADARRVGRLLGAPPAGGWVGPGTAPGSEERARRHQACMEGALGGGPLSPDDLALLAECLDELDRAGNFERIYPTPDAARRYGPLFETRRYNNILLADFVARSAPPPSRGLPRPGLGFDPRRPGSAPRHGAGPSRADPARQSAPSPQGLAPPSRTRSPLTRSRTVPTPPPSRQRRSLPGPPRPSSPLHDRPPSPPPPPAPPQVSASPRPFSVVAARPGPAVRRPSAPILHRVSLGLPTAPASAPPSLLGGPLVTGVRTLLAGPLPALPPSPTRPATSHPAPPARPAPAPSRSVPA